MPQHKDSSKMSTNSVFEFGLSIKHIRAIMRLKFWGDVSSPSSWIREKWGDSKEKWYFSQYLNEGCYPMVLETFVNLSTNKILQNQINTDENNKGETIMASYFYIYNRCRIRRLFIYSFFYSF